jgi:hypothetical protein
MIIRLIIASVVIAAPAAFAAGYWESQHQGEVPATVGVRLNAPILTKPGSGSADAAKYLAVLNTPPPPPPPPGAQPPDVGLTFRKDVTAVTTDRTPHVILADGRQLARGQDYRDGWKVRLITTESVTLAKGAETRSINLFSAPAAATQAPSGFAGVGGFGQVSLTNGARPGQLGVGQINFILDTLRAIGLSQVQLDQLRSTLGRSMTPQQATQMITAALRGRTVSQAQITNLVQAFVSAGVIPQPAANALTQQLFAQQQNQQLQGILGGGGRGGGGGPPNGGGRPGFGGAGGRRGGPLGLTPPNVTPPGAAPAAVPAPGAPASAPALAPTAQREDGQAFRLAQLAGQFHQDKATNQ